MNGIPESLYQCLKTKEVGYIPKITDQSHYLAAAVNCSQLNNRLSLFIEEHNTISEAQTAFRKGYSTLDQFFFFFYITSLNKYLEKKGKGNYIVFLWILRKYSIRYLECNFGISYYNII